MKRAFDRWLGGTRNASSVCWIADFASPDWLAKLFHRSSFSNRALSKHAAICLMS